MFILVILPISHLSNIITFARKGKRAAMKTALTTEGKAVIGMADVYNQLKTTRNASTKPAAFHYVSAAPYQLLPSVAEFLTANGFPSGSLHLRDIWVSENMSSRNYKRNVISKIMKVR